MNKTSKEYLNSLLAPYGACISTELSCVQLKAPGYIGDQFADTNKTVKDFQIVSIASGKSFANVDSDIYHKIPRDILSEVFNSYYETAGTIYC